MADNARLTQWRVIDTFRLRECTTDTWHISRRKSPLMVSAKRYGEVNEAVGGDEQAHSSWRRLLRNIFPHDNGRALAEHIKD